jgi:DMSO reductase anchor subunit
MFCSCKACNEVTEAWRAVLFAFSFLCVQYAALQLLQASVVQTTELSWTSAPFFGAVCICGQALSYVARVEEAEQAAGPLLNVKSSKCS